MDLLVKLTFYDLLGYTLPGTVLLGLWRWNAQGQSSGENMSTADGVALIVLGYLVGIMISEVAARVFGFGARVFSQKKSKNTSKGLKGPLGKTCEDCGITADMLAARLQEEEMLENGEVQKMKDARGKEGTQDKEEDFKELEKYKSWIYAVIQRDPQSRIHNYASAALLYKNMVIVSAVAVFLGIWYGLWQEWAAGLLGIFLFSIRYVKFNKKTLTYTLCWFVKKQE